MHHNSRRPHPLAEEIVDLNGDDAGSHQPRLAQATDADESAPRIDRRVLVRAIAALVAFVAILIGAYFIPLPSIGQAREWSTSMGPWFVAVFFIAYAVVTIFPFPRTAFTVPAGVLFAPGVAFTGSMIATMFAAIVAFVVVRRLGRQRVQPYLRKPIFRAIEERLSRRGWLAVGSLRLIAACPFSVANYTAALSSVRFIPYVVASVIGIAPGTAAVIFMGGALAGESSPATLALSAVLFASGILGLVIDARLPTADR